MQNSVKLLLLFVIVLLVFTAIILLVTFLTYGEPDACDIYASSLKYDRNSNISDIIISLTTMPLRLQSSDFKKCVSSMLEQSVRPQQIRINIPYTLKKSGVTYEIPDWLPKVSVTIHRCDDMGPATKYLSTLADYAGTKQKILVYDDDGLMPLNTVKTFQKLTNKYPNTVISGAGNRLARKFDENGVLMSTSTNPDKEGASFWGKSFWLVNLIESQRLTRIPPNDEIEKVDIIYGNAGYCLRADMVDINILSDYTTMPKEACFVDDLVISGHLASRKVSRAVGKEVQLPRQTYSGMLQAFRNQISADAMTESLSLSVNRDNNNNATMIKYFASAWGEFPP